MSVKLYDDALLRKLQRWTDKTAVVVTSTDETDRLLSVLADKNNDNPISFPLIALRRAGGYSVDIRGKRDFTANGFILESTNSASQVVNAIPVTIPYKIDVYCRYREEAEEYMKNLIFNLINYPKLNVEVVNRDMRFNHDANIHITGDVEDTSDMPPRVYAGQFTRYTIELSIDDAYLFDLRVKNNISIVGYDVVVED